MVRKMDDDHDHGNLPNYRVVMYSLTICAKCWFLLARPVNMVLRALCFVGLVVLDGV